MVFFKIQGRKGIWALMTMRHIRDEFGNWCLVLEHRRVRKRWQCFYAYLSVVALVSHHEEGRSTSRTLADLIGG